MNSPTPGSERRHGPDERTQLWFNETLGRFEDSLKKHIDDKFEQFNKDAFPSGDAHKHRAAHEKTIEKSKRWEDMKAAFITKAFTGGSYAALVFLALLVWEWIKQELKK